MRAEIDLLGRPLTIQGELNQIGSLAFGEIIDCDPMTINLKFGCLGLFLGCVQSPNVFLLLLGSGLSKPRSIVRKTRSFSWTRIRTLNWRSLGESGFPPSCCRA